MATKSAVAMGCRESEEQILSLGPSTELKLLEMSSEQTTYRVFISYTGEDLEAHADAVADVIRKLEWIAIDHKFWSPSGRPSVEECREQVSSCDILVVLVAHRYGWVPTVQEGGDGEKSITWIEVDHARSSGLEVIPFLLDEDAAWPGNLVECRFSPASLEPLNRFKAQLQAGVAGFFSTPVTIEKELPLALPKAAARIAMARREHRVGSKETVTDDRQDSDSFTPFYFDPEHPPTLAERLETQLPKRILALDGHGKNTLVLLGYLGEIERLLQVRYGDSDFRLGDYFDLITGIGFSAPLAVGVAEGRRVANLRQMFPRLVEAALVPRWDGVRLSRKRIVPELETVFGDHLIHDDRYRTGFCIAGALERTRSNVTVQSSVAITNHPSCAHTVRSSVRDLVLGSMFMPLLGAPVTVDLGGGGQQSLFSGEGRIGGDPALFSFMVATGSREFPFHWRTGMRRLFLLSVGEGRDAQEVQKVSRRGGPLAILQNIASTHFSAQAGLRQQSRHLLQVLDPAGSEHAEFAPADWGEPVLTFRRLEVPVAPGALQDLGIAVPSAKGLVLRAPFTQRGLQLELEIGDRAASARVDDSLFLSSFDVRRPVHQA
jgi:Domain of unknown function (DUF4062)